MKSVTIADVAKEAKVSKSTVSQFLNERYEYMGSETKKRIEEAIQTLGYRPNIIARSLKQKTTTTIGVIAANILHSFTTEVTRAIEDFCIDHGFHTILCNADDNPEKEKKYIEMLQAKQVDGLIIFPTGGNVELYEKMVANNYPLVFIDRYLEDVRVPSVCLNNERAAEIAVQHFVEQGYERIGLMTTSIMNHITPRIERVNGFKKALQKYGLPIVDDFLHSVELEAFEEKIDYMLSLNSPPEAILAGNDLALMEILRVINKKNVMIRKDVALIGIDDVAFAGFYNPNLTTIAQPTFDMGKKAAALLLKQVNQEKVERNDIYRFEPKIIKRDSC